MKIHKTPIDGVLLIEPHVFGDERGFFMETWRAADFMFLGADANFVQDNHSRSTQWSLRGMHMQTQHTQGKLVRVSSGTVFDVVIDLRRSSTTFGRWWGMELSDENHYMVWIPPGLAHGMLVTSASADFLYKCTDIYSPEHERTLAWNDKTVGVEWPMPTATHPILSSKDLRGQSFADIEKFK